MSSVKEVGKTTEVELTKIKNILYNNLDMLFEKLEDLDKLDTNGEF